ncbi:MAG: citrate lyase acyl carrier protein [Clostridium sp.]
MQILKPAKAGTMESNDVYVMIMPNPDGGIELELESIVMKQFGKEIERVIRTSLSELGVENAVLKVQDKGALNYTIRARIETVISRAASN